jgi:hypothetical protein
MTGPYRLTRPTAQPSGPGIPACYRSDATDDGAACHLCFEPDTQQALLRVHPSCERCAAGQWAAKLFYAQWTQP